MERYNSVWFSDASKVLDLNHLQPAHIEQELQDRNDRYVEVGHLNIWHYRRLNKLLRKLRKHEVNISAQGHNL